MRARRAVLAAVLASALAVLAPTPAQAAFGLRPGPEGFEVRIDGEGEAVDSEAGSHPAALTATVNFNLEGGGPFTEGDLKDLDLELPPGLIENANVLPTCSQAEFLTPRSSPWEKSLSGESCRDRTQVGMLILRSSHGGGEERSFGLFNLAPPPGTPSELGANPYGSPIVFVPSVRQADGEYGTTLKVADVSQHVALSGLTLTIWGAPWAAVHNTQRGNCLKEVEPGFGWAKTQVL